VIRRFPDWMIRRDPQGCRKVLERNLNEAGLMGRFVQAVSPWCGTCSWFVGAEPRGACPGVWSEKAAEPPVCLRDAAGVLVAFPALGGPQGRGLAACG